MSILLLLALAIAAGVVGAAGLFAEMWWHYRLEREPGGTLRVRRGLLTTRSITLEEQRLRGVEVVEPLGARLAGAARVDAVATGMKRDDDKTDSKTLLPAAPRAVAHDVAAKVLGEPVLDDVRLVPHPPAARGRRLRWALLAAAVAGARPPAARGAADGRPAGARRGARAWSCCRWPWPSPWTPTAASGTARPRGTW